MARTIRSEFGPSGPSNVLLHTYVSLKRAPELRKTGIFGITSFTFCPITSMIKPPFAVVSTLGIDASEPPLPDTALSVMGVDTAYGQKALSEPSQSIAERLAERPARKLTSLNGRVAEQRGAGPKGCTGIETETPAGACLIARGAGHVDPFSGSTIAFSVSSSKGSQP